MSLIAQGSGHVSVWYAVAAMPAPCLVCPVCGSTNVQTTVRKTITVCHCLTCKASWHVLRDAEPTAA